MSCAAALLLITFSPSLLVSFGLLRLTSLEGATAYFGMVVGVPALVLLALVAGFSMAGLIRGPTRHRWQVGAWWLLLVGSVAASDATAKEPGFNPYLGTPHPGLGLSDVIITVGLLLAIVLPLVWWKPGGAADP